MAVNSPAMRPPRSLQRTLKHAMAETELSMSYGTPPRAMERVFEEPDSAPADDDPAPARRHGVMNLGLWLSLGLAAAAVAACILTFSAMSGRAPALSEPRVILLLLLADLALLLALTFLVLYRLVWLWSHRRGDAVGRRLHLRLLTLFGLVAATPTLIVSVFSMLVVVLGLQDWLGERVRSALGASLSVGKAYLSEHRHGVAADLVSMSDGLLRAGVGSQRTSTETLYLMERQIAVLRLSQAALFYTEVDSSDAQAPVRGAPQIVAQVTAAQFAGSGGADGAAALDGASGDAPEETPAAPDLEVSDWAFARADAGEIVVLHTEGQDRVRALRRLGSENAGGAGVAQAYYLLVSRAVDARVLGHIEETSFAVTLYEQLEGQRAGFIITFSAVFVVLSLLLLLSASWVGIAFANRLNRPLAALISTAAALQGGALSARVPRDEERGELGIVARAFNRMSGALEKQQRALLSANHALDERRAFIEATLAGVSSGVVALDAEARVQMLNDTAARELGVSAERLLGRRFASFSRDLGRLMEAARAAPERVHSAEVTRPDRSGGRARTYAVRVAARMDQPGKRQGARADGALAGFVVTFDDLTDSLSAQRKAAWADVARAIAHEIKNPLTPIQLSAERLERRVAADAEGSDADAVRERALGPVRESVGTITRQVQEIRRMVDEFSDFARMPEPKRQPLRLDLLLHEMVALLEPGFSPHRLELEVAEALSLSGDAGQLRRLVLNLIKNASWALAERRDEERKAGNKDWRGVVRVRLAREEAPGGAVAAVRVEDDGPGLPGLLEGRLTDPYVTTRSTGSGLGLAIVSKIAEDHGGRFTLRNRAAEGSGAERGAVAVVRLPIPEGDGAPRADGGAGAEAVR